MTDRVGWLHCLAGASGDMLLGALVDAGARLDTLRTAVAAVGVEPMELSAHAVTRHGLVATRVQVQTPADPVRRTWADVRTLLESAELDPAVCGGALAAFGRLARAEARVHGVEPAAVRFHEVGALDAIADVVGAMAGLAELGLLPPSGRLVASPVTLGSGTASGAHGVVPVPSPAVLALLREVGAPVHAGPAAYEMCTPTGAAVLAATVDAWGELPPMVVEEVGSGAGSREVAEVPNVLRLVLGRPVPGDGRDGGESAFVVAANVDDLDPRLWPGVLVRLLEAGAADAWLTPILMKKGRPAHTLSVLTSVEALEAVRRVVFAETSTIGLRVTPTTKVALPRETARVHVDGVPVRVKVVRLDDRVVSVTPEYDDVATAAAALGRPVKAVLAAAVAAAHDTDWGDD